MRILVTRPAGEAEATRRRLEALGHKVLLEPLLRIERRAEPMPAGRFDGLLVTSGNAIAALADRPEAEVLRRLPLAAVGRRTAEAARSAGFAAVLSAGRDAAALVASIGERWAEPRRLLYLAGADRSTDLAAALSPMGHDVAVWVVYDAIAATELGAETRQALAAGAIDAVLHYSARTAETYAALAGPVAPLSVSPPRHLCLSQKVAETLMRRGAGAVVVAERPDEDALFACLPAGPARAGSGR